MSHLRKVFEVHRYDMGNLARGCPGNTQDTGVRECAVCGHVPALLWPARLWGSGATWSGAAAPIPCTVLDIFAGAGTTLLVANRLGRRAIGIELNPEYVEMARKRIASGNGATVEQAKELAADVQIRLF